MVISRPIIRRVSAALWARGSGTRVPAHSAVSAAPSAALALASSYVGWRACAASRSASASGRGAARTVRSSSAAPPTRQPSRCRSRPQARRCRPRHSPHGQAAPVGHGARWESKVVAQAQAPPEPEPSTVGRGRRRHTCCSHSRRALKPLVAASACRPVDAYGAWGSCWAGERVERTCRVAMRCARRMASCDWARHLRGGRSTSVPHRDERHDTPRLHAAKLTLYCWPIAH